jgi:hypothetical protein
MEGVQTTITGQITDSVVIRDRQKIADSAVLGEKKKSAQRRR